MEKAQGGKNGGEMTNGKKKIGGGMNQLGKIVKEKTDGVKTGGESAGRHF